MPQEGSKAHQVYLYLMQGKSQSEIEALLPERTRNQIQNSIFKIRNPEKVNADKRNRSKP